jgi:hypothetical protein
VHGNGEATSNKQTTKQTNKQTIERTERQKDRRTKPKMSALVKPTEVSAGVAATGAASLPVPAYFNMDGKWQVIKERSESLYTHMKALGCDEIAALASEKLDIWLNIEHSPDDPVIRIYQTSQLGTTLRELNTTKEVAEQSVQVRNVGIHIAATIFNTSIYVHVRQLLSR